MRRSGSLKLGLVAAISLAANVASADAGLEVSVSVAPEAPCITLESLSAQLSAEGLKIADSGALDVDVSASAPGVRLRARRQDDGRLLVRTIPARAGRCEGVERAAVMLIREWARAARLVTPAGPTPDAGVVVTRRVERPAVIAVIDAGIGAPSSPQPDASVAEPEPGDGGILLEPPPAPVVVMVDAGPPPRVVVAEPPITVTRWEVRLAVAGGFSAAATPHVVPAGSLVLDVGKDALGGSLDATLEGEAVLSEAPGQVNVNVQWLTIAARWRFSWLERLSLDLALGLRGSRLTATASGFTTNSSVTLLGLGPAAMGTLWLRLFGPLQLMVRASAALRLPAESLVVLDTGPTFAIGIAQLGVVGGLGVAWP